MQSECRGAAWSALLGSTRLLPLFATGGLHEISANPCDARVLRKESAHLVI